MDAFVIAVLFIAGLIGTFYSAMVGGLSILTVPVLLVLGLPARETIAVNLAAQLLPSAITVLNYNRHGKLKVSHVMPFLLPFIIGAAIGAVIVIGLDAQVTNVLLAILLIGGSLLVLFEKRINLSFLKKNFALQAILLTLIGMYKGVFGAAAKTLTMMILRVTTGMGFVEVSATATFLLFFAVLAGSIPFYFSGLITMDYFIPLTIGSCIGAVIGSETAVKKGDAFVRSALILVALIGVAKVLFF